MSHRRHLGAFFQRSIAKHGDSASPNLASSLFLCLLVLRNEERHVRLALAGWLNLRPSRRMMRVEPRGEPPPPSPFLQLCALEEMTSSRRREDA